MHADVTVIDPADQATYAEPLRPATGVRHVLVGGVPVLAHSRSTGARPDRVLLWPNDFQGVEVAVIRDPSCRIRPGSSRRSPALASRYDMDATFMS